MKFHTVEIEAGERTFVHINLNHIVAYEESTCNLYMVDGIRYTLAPGEWDVIFMYIE